MNFKNKLPVGVIVAIIGCFGLIFASPLGFTTLSRPWSFIAGFIIGMIITLGLSLFITGLFERKQNRNN
jgi:hydrogenase/urease accessory protein HupE